MKSCKKKIYNISSIKEELNNLNKYYIIISELFSNQIYNLISELHFNLNKRNEKNVKSKNNYLCQTPIFTTKKRNFPEFQINNEKEGKIIRTVKNKKIVYCKADPHSLSLIDKTQKENTNNSSNDNIINKEINKFKILEKNNIKYKGQRGSKYRGVSKNGNQWQVLIMINKKKRYIGNYKTEEEAASSYDIVAIQNHGNKAKTNFYYSPDAILKIKKMKKIYYWDN